MAILCPDQMIELQEYLEAGFTQAQAALLVARDRRIDDRLDMLHTALNRGFADMLSTMQALTNQTINGFAAMGTRLDTVEERLGSVEQRLGHVESRLVVLGRDIGRDSQALVKG